MRHRFHALCPYFAMFPEAFPERWIDRLTKEGDTVLDPFCGRGTTPFQAILMGRKALATDTSPVAVCITGAKVTAPLSKSVFRRLTILEQTFREDEWENQRRRLPEFFRVAYNASTLRQLLFLRARLNWRTSRVDRMIAALTLGAIHGDRNSSRYLSNQMPRTIGTKPAYSIRFWMEHGLTPPRRNVFAILREQTRFRYETPPPADSGKVFSVDMRDLPRVLRETKLVDCVVTSPPYLDGTSYGEDQWLRLWFLGGPDYPTRSGTRGDDRHTSANGYWRMIADMWRMLGQTVRPGGHVVIRLGSRQLEPEALAEAVFAAARGFSGRRVRLAASETSEVIRKQTRAFRPGAPGFKVEVDMHFILRG